MATETHKCANPKCKTPKNRMEYIVQLHEDNIHLDRHCLKRNKTVDEVKLQKLTTEATKWRCEPCFKNFVKRNKLEEFYHLVE